MREFCDWKKRVGEEFCAAGARAGTFGGVQGHQTVLQSERVYQARCKQSGDTSYSKVSISLGSLRLALVFVNDGPSLETRVMTLISQTSMAILSHFKGPFKVRNSTFTNA